MNTTTNGCKIKFPRLLPQLCLLQMDTVCGSWQQGISYAELCLWGWGRLGAPPALCCLSQVTTNSPGERAVLKAGAATWCWHCSVSAGHAAGSLLHREMSPASLVTPPQHCRESSDGTSAPKPSRHGENSSFSAQIPRSFGYVHCSGARGNSPGLGWGGRFNMFSFIKYHLSGMP